MVQLSSILPNLVGHTISAPDTHTRLHFLELLGSGAYGIVYLAYDLHSPPENPSFYAVKCLLRHPQGSDYAHAQEREIRLHRFATEQGHCDNIVCLHCVIYEEHYVYLVMDYCPGGDLFTAIIDHCVFAGNDDAVKSVFIQLIDAVDACHNIDVYHRDLKPENIMCSKDYSQVFLSDFGLATQAKWSNTFGCGSSFYMSPECIGLSQRNVPYSTREADVWSLGVILNNMITGRNPWHIASPCSDEGFSEFLKDGVRYLTNALPISLSAALLLTRIFDPKPSSRITLPELRKATLDVDTFFRPQQHARIEPTRPAHVALSIQPPQPGRNLDAPAAMIAEGTAEALALPSSSIMMEVDLGAFPAPPAPSPSPALASSSASPPSSQPPVTTTTKPAGAAAQRPFATARNHPHKRRRLSFRQHRAPPDPEFRAPRYCITRPPFASPCPSANSSSSSSGADSAGPVTPPSVSHALRCTIEEEDISVLALGSGNTPASSTRPAAGMAPPIQIQIRAPPLSTLLAVGPEAAFPNPSKGLFPEKKASMESGSGSRLRRYYGLSRKVFSRGRFSGSAFSSGMGSESGGTNEGFGSSNNGVDAGVGITQAVTAKPRFPHLASWRFVRGFKTRT